MKFRKKPVVVEAFKWTGDIYQKDDPVWILEAIRDERVCLVFKGTEHVRLNIETLEGVMSAMPGDYVIRGVQGEIYPCKPDIFEATYEEA